MGFRAICKFTDWLVRPQKEYGPQLRFGPYTFLSLTNQSVNLYIALKPMFYLLIIARLFYMEVSLRTLVHINTMVLQAGPMTH